MPSWAKPSEEEAVFLYMPSHGWQQYHMHFALKLKLAFSITLLLLGCFDVFSKGQVCVCVYLGMCVHACVCALGLFIDVCWYLFDVCPALRGWKVNSLISPWSQLAL